MSIFRKSIGIGQNAFPSMPAMVAEYDEIQRCAYKRHGIEIPDGATAWKSFDDVLFCSRGCAMQQVAIDKRMIAGRPVEVKYI